MNDLNDIQASIQAGQLVVVAGAGTSLSLASRRTPAYSWPKLLENAFTYAEKMGRIDDRQRQRWSETISSGDLDELLGAAEFVSRKLDGRNGLLYSRWLESLFSSQKFATSSRMKDALSLITKHGIPICTLNYDTLIERCTRLPSINMDDHRKVLSWARRSHPGILHLHGQWEKPETIVLGVSDYNDATTDDFRLSLQQALSTFNRLLFIGCGDTLYDPNLSSLLRWMRDTLGADGLQHYALVRDQEVEAKHRDPTWQGLVAPIGYGDNFESLPTFLIDKLVPVQTAKRPDRRSKIKSDSEVIQNYRKYLVADCGKMTIEGVRADADTAKQKFDLEKLFVPLEVDPVPPEFSASDPQREKKLKEWTKRNASALPFGEALRKGSKLALLALPGGGKTLLLKRLAVAYSDPVRRTATDDHLPDADLLPILIRCREWRDHISLPISSIINKIHEIAGQNTLKGLFDAIQDRLKTGRILLLVDGLDEIHSDADRTTFVENLEAFLDEHRKIRLVVTSREAGFALVAPSLMRFCSRWRIAPLSENAIKQLCSHWHSLMGGVSLEVQEETRIVVDTILANESLRRLAENPLLLTMLLVVKHGFGRLPPDRVTLYERAVEVLLDTWNIRGHAALNPREAVPQLAFVAFRMMQDGKQTATERELLALIEECRREVPMVRLYAKDSPSEFLKRVELRSSLLLEAGKSLEGGKTVPFYQFRHLTFQEYMAAIAIVEGHYKGYAEDHSVSHPLGNEIANDEWKEVVPMAAVLAKKRASSLIVDLIAQAEQVEIAFLSGDFSSKKYEWNSNYRLPAAVSRLLQCLVEEAEFSQSTLDSSLRLVATFAHGCQSQENWTAVVRGPFGANLFEEAWKLFSSRTLPRESWIRNTVALMAYYRKSPAYWVTVDGTQELRDGLTGASEKDRGVAAATICGMFWRDRSEALSVMNDLRGYVEAYVMRDDDQGSVYGVWALAMMFARQREQGLNSPKLSPATLDKLTSTWLTHFATGNVDDLCGFTIAAGAPLEKEYWTPKLSLAQRAVVQQAVLAPANADGPRNTDAEAAAILAYLDDIAVDSRAALQALSNGYRGGSEVENEAQLLAYFGASEDDLQELARTGRLRRRRSTHSKRRGVTE